MKGLRRLGYALNHCSTFIDLLDLSYVGSIIINMQTSREGHMVTLRDPRVSYPFAFLLMGLLCVCVTMYALGTTITLWNLQESTDPFTGPVLEGFSLPSMSMALAVSLQTSFAFTPLPAKHGILLEHTLFHPPDSRA